MKQLTKDGQVYWQCDECGFVYVEKRFAEQCEAWCREHHACNNDIVQYAVLREGDLRDVDHESEK